MENKDYIVRATAADGNIRAFAATTREMVEYARCIHETSPVATAALGRTLTASAMMGITMKGEKDLMTVSVKGDGPIGGITVTADSKGNVKGYVNEPYVIIPARKDGKLNVGGAVGKGTLTVIKDMGLKEPYSGTIELTTGEIADDFTYYFAVSEQVPSAVGLGVLLNHDNHVEQAGGFIIQLMPFADDKVIAALEERLKNVKSVTELLSEGMNPEDILEYLLKDMGLEIHEKVSTGFKCDCSKNRIERALISLGKKELRGLIDDEKPMEVSCHFCNHKYEFTKEDLNNIINNIK